MGQSISAMLEDLAKRSHVPGAAEASASAEGQAVVLAGTTDVMAKYNDGMSAFA